jgi:YgiT-type zinc finger domain-containing protein
MSYCPTCQLGRLQRRIMVYIQWYGDNLLVANRMPAMVCEVCGERVYDHQAVESLQQLLWSYPPMPAKVVPTHMSTPTIENSG